MRVRTSSGHEVDHGLKLAAHIVGDADVERDDERRLRAVPDLLAQEVHLGREPAIEEARGASGWQGRDQEPKTVVHASFRPGRKGGLRISATERTTERNGFRAGL